jgi:hypothetical protein
MRSRFLFATTAFVALVSLSAASVSACEKHLKGHQNSSDSQVEAVTR